MFMISKFMYEAVYQPRGSLIIEPYTKGNHQANYYYFRLGARKQGADLIPIGDAGLIIPRHSFVPVWSLENFTLSERVLGLFGSLTALLERGLQLVNSLSIDPTFSGCLSLGIRNNTDNDEILHAGERIGKILFFDVSDTFYDAEGYLNNLKRKDLSERAKVAEEMMRIGKQIIEPYVDTISDEFPHK